MGRVPVQVKGRTSTRTLKRKRDTASFQVDRDVLTFFRGEGGGVYFYVSMSSDSADRSILYAILLPHKIDRLLNNGNPSQKSFAVSLRRLPEDPHHIEKIFQLALEGRKQGKLEGIDSNVLQGLRSITIHSIDAIHEDRPTVFNLDETDFAVTIETADGIRMPFDMDLTVYPASYVPQKSGIEIQCGTITYSQSTVQQVDPKTIRFQLSEGLSIRAEEGELSLETHGAEFSHTSPRAQLKELDFFLAALRGEALVIDGISHISGSASPDRTRRLSDVRDRLNRIMEVLDALGIDEQVFDDYTLTIQDRRTLLHLHKALVLDQEVGGQTDGFGRYDFKLGQCNIVTLIAPGSSNDKQRIIDPFNPAMRARFRMYRTAEDQSVEEFVDGTVYDSLDAAEMVATLNLHVHAIAEAYDALGNRSATVASANQTLLNFLRAADMASGWSHRNLLEGAAILSDWLVSNGEDTLVYQINRWQVRRRRGQFTAEDSTEVRRARRALQRTVSEDAILREACLVILLEDPEELALVLDELSADQLDALRSWPIWSLVARDGGPPLSA